MTLIAFAVAGVLIALIGRSVVLHVLAHDRERMKSHDAEATAKSIRELKSEVAALTDRVTKGELGRIGR